MLNDETSRSFLNLVFQKVFIFQIFLHASMPIINIGFGGVVPFLFFNLVALAAFRFDRIKLKGGAINILIFLTAISLFFSALKISFLGYSIDSKVWVGVIHIVDALIISFVLFNWRGSRITTKSIWDLAFSVLIIVFLLGLVETFVYSDITSWTKLFHENTKNLEYLKNQDVARARLFFSEPAQAGVYLVIFGGGLVLSSPTRDRRIAAAAVVIALLLMVGSRGVFLGLLLSFCLAVLASLRYLNFRLVVSMLSAFIALFCSIAVLIVYKPAVHENLYFMFENLILFIVRLSDVGFSDLQILVDDEFRHVATRLSRLLQQFSTLEILFSDLSIFIFGTGPYGLEYYKEYAWDSLIIAPSLDPARDFVLLEKSNGQNSFITVWAFGGLSYLLLAIAWLTRLSRSIFERRRMFYCWAYIFSVVICGSLINLPSVMIVIAATCFLAIKVRGAY